MSRRNPRVVVEFDAESGTPIGWRLEGTDLTERKRLLARVALIVRQLEGLLRRGGVR